MKPIRAFGIALAVAGAVLLFLGLNAPAAPAEPASEALTGGYSNHTLWSIVGGFGAVIAGASMTLPRRRLKPINPLLPPRKDKAS